MVCCHVSTMYTPWYLNAVVCTVLKHMSDNLMNKLQCSIMQYVHCTFFVELNNYNIDLQYEYII